MDKRANMPAALKALLEAGRSFDESAVTDEKLKQAERAAEDPFAYNEWDKTWAGYFAKLTEFYWPVILTMLLTALGILVIQFLGYLALFQREGVELGWWCVLPVGIGMLIAASTQHMRAKYQKRVEALRKLIELRHRQSKELAHLMVEYLDGELEMMDRRHSDLQQALRGAMDVPEGTVALRPTDQTVALQAVWALLKDETFPAAVATITRAEYAAFYDDRRLIDPNEYHRVQAQEAAYRKHWPEVAEKLRQLVQQIWEGKRSEGSDPLSATVRHELIKALREHWGADSYAYKFVQDLCKGK